MAGYTKLFSSILASTIWEADMPTRIVWITLLAMADQRGVAEGSVPGLATFARVSIAQCRHALAALSAPDADSRSKEADGRRIEAVDGGWRLINHGKYREKMGQDERREYLRLKQAEQRKRRQLGVNNRQQTSTQSTHAEADTDAEASPEAGSSEQDLDHPKSDTHAQPEPVWRPAGARPQALTNGARLRRHAGHAWCADRDGFCVIHALHEEILGKSAKPEAEVKAWYQSTVAKHRGLPVGEDGFTFWRNELAAWVGTATSKPRDSKTGQTAALLRRLETSS